jgi:hypothetical protein
MVQEETMLEVGNGSGQIYIRKTGFTVGITQAP